MHHSPPQNGIAERGMRTRAEQAHALLLSSGLPHFLWEEAMKHTTWLQDHTPAQALNGKTPYKMGNKKKPHPAGIQEFGVATYIKDLTARKLNAQAKKGHFMGYDSESKEYRIYWPEKRSITVECNIVLNQDDINTCDNNAIIYGKIQSEGEKNKVIQTSQHNARDIEAPENKEPSDQPTLLKQSEPHPSSKPSNSVP